jgi:hypothetical protein
MERRTLLCAVVACIALASCAPIQRSDGLATSTQECRAATCQIDVTVNGSINLVEFLVVTFPRGQPVNLMWKLPEGSPYTLEIKIINGGDQFPDCRPDGPRKFMCIDKHSNTTSTTYKYLVKVTGPNTLEKDPYIVND